MQPIEVVESVTKTIGSPALANPYLRRLRPAESIEALVLNRLQPRPVPISRIGA